MSAIRGPFGKRNFAQQDWLYPMNRSPFTSAESDGLAAAEHGPGCRNPGQAIIQFLGALHREARSDLARVLKGSIFPVAEIERTQGPLAASGITVSDYDEFLPERTFDFEPTLAAARDVWGIGLFRDDALESGFASLRKHLFALARRHGRYNAEFWIFPGAPRVSPCALPASLSSNLVPSRYRRSKT